MEKQPNFNSKLRFSEDYPFAYNILMLVIPYLDFKDLLSCSEVCNMWNAIIKEASFWSTYCLRLCSQHLEQLPKRKELYVKKIKIWKTRSYLHNVNILTQAVNLEELELKECYFNFSDKFTSMLKNLKVLIISQSFRQDEDENPFTSDFFKSLSNLSKLSITTTFKVPLSGIETLKKLKELFLDARYDETFLNIEPKVFVNMDSFGIGFTYYNHNIELMSDEDNDYNLKLLNDCNQKLPGLLKHMKHLKRLQLYGFKDDFSILKTVSQLKQLEILELGLTQAWNSYSSLLPICKNVRHLFISFYLPQECSMNIQGIAAQNSILFATVKELKDTLKEFTWIFDMTYQEECEEVLAIKNGKWQSNITTIWSNVSDFEPKNFTVSAIQNIARERNICEVPLSILEEMVVNEFPDTKVRVGSKCPEECEYCPKNWIYDHNVTILKTLRKDRFRIRYIRDKIRRQELKLN